MFKCPYSKEDIKCAKFKAVLLKLPKVPKPCLRCEKFEGWMEQTRLKWEPERLQSAGSCNELPRIAGTYKVP